MNTKNRTLLENKTVKTLEKDNWECERAYAIGHMLPNGRFVNKRHDFFNIIDIFAVKCLKIRLIQVTSGDEKDKQPMASLKKHMKKIEENWKHRYPVELWFYMKIKNRWKLTNIYVYYDGKWSGELK